MAQGAADSTFWQIITPFTLSNGSIVVATNEIAANSVIDLYPADDPSQACAADVNAAKQLVLPTAAAAPCGKLVGKLLDGSIPGLVYKVHGTSKISLLHLAVTAVRDPATHAELGEKLDFKSIRANADCYLVLPDIVALSNCNHAEVTAEKPEVFAALKAALKRGDKPFLIANVSDADSIAGTWQRVPITLKKSSDSGDDDGASTDFPDRCKAVMKASRSRLDNRYAICADVYAARQSILVSQCDEKGNDCTSAGENVRTNRPFTVFTWTDKGNTAKVTLDGIAGSSSGIYEKSGTDKVNGGATPASDKAEIWEFGARKAGQAKLAVVASKSKDGGGTTEVARVDYPFTVEDVFNILPRLGLGFSYQPSGAVVGITSTNDGQRYSALTRGPGTFNLEILAGMSYMLTPIRQNSHDFSAGLGLRVGLASLNGDPKLLTSVMGGLEFGFGVDIAIGLYMGVARNDAPDNNYEVGKLIPPMVNAIPTHMVARQSFALVIDFMPSVSKSMGLAK